MSFNGNTPYHNPSVGAGDLVKAGAGKLNCIVAMNMTSSARFLKIYDKATAPVLGTTIPVFLVGLQASMLTPVVINLGSPGGDEEESGMRFLLGLGVAASTSAADADSGATSTGDVLVSLLYR